MLLALYFALTRLSFSPNPSTNRPNRRPRLEAYLLVFDPAGIPGKGNTKLINNAGNSSIGTFTLLLSSIRTKRSAFRLSRSFAPRLFCGNLICSASATFRDRRAPQRTCLVGAKGAVRTLDSEHSPNILWNDMLKRQRCRPIAIDATLGADSIFFPAIRMLTFHFSQRFWYRRCHVVRCRTAVN